jgi:DNA mismatch repair protein MutS
MAGDLRDPRETPAMQQYYRFKKRHPDCVLLFRIGDFYELFDDDAVTVSKAIGLTLTQRTEGVPMCGMPYHQLDTYLKRLIAQGFRVAVCEQLMEASQAPKGLVPRAVTRVLTPGTLVDESLLESEAPTTLAAIIFTGEGDDSPASLAVVEVATGLFTLIDCTHDTIADELARRGVRELLYAAADLKPAPRVKKVLERLGLSGTPRASWQFRVSEALEALTTHFQVTTLAGFGLREDDPALPAAGAIIRYLLETQTLSDEDAKTAASAGVASTRASLKHLRPPRREDPQSFVTIDAVSLRSLEIEKTIRGQTSASAGALEGSLLGVFLAAVTGPRSVIRTPMGKRTLRDWLCRPLRDLHAIEARQHAVATLIDDRTLAAQLGGTLDTIQDIARIAGRVSLGRATPRDLVGLARSLDKADALLEAIEGVPALASIEARIRQSRDSITPIASAILAACIEEPPAHLRDGGLIRDGFDAALDEARLLQRDSTSWLADYQGSLVARHKLPGLKVGFNKVSGYYIELPQAQSRNAPPELTRKQTLKNAERYTTPELREYETKVTSAEARALDRERDIFTKLCEQATTALAPISLFSDTVAELDVLLGFADKAQRRGWTRPTIIEQPALQIHAGRHPVLDESLGGDFVPNDIELGDRSAFAYPSGSDIRHPTSDMAALALITGPNMAGKSTYIRQTALLTLLAHTGSFIPADRATIGLIDRIFTRIGADDALHAGQSTFMVEMIETANILNHATPNSLVILDEIGRGTSTLDGLSLAWAIVEHLANPPSNPQSAIPTPQSGPRTLFATHYHELTDLEERLPGRVTNLHVAVREWPGGDDHAQIVFLHRILPGRTDQSYGLHVARLAGIPATVVSRGREVLASLAVHTHGAAASTAKPDPKKVPKARSTDEDGQLPLFTQYIQHPAVDALREVKLDSLTPLQAFDTLRQLKSLSVDSP